jgi:poly(3-hydroxybutyrate) depolymerase
VSSAASDSGPASSVPVADASARQTDSGNPQASGGGSDAAVSIPDAGAKDSGAPDATPGNDAGMPIANGAAKPSAGCGMAAPMAGNATIDISGTSRAYILALPQNYDPKKPYRLIFAWHGLGGSADQVARGGYYGLQSRSQNGAIFVAGQGLDTMALGMTAPGWANANGQDVAFVKALYARLQSTLCIDESRVFSAGMSYGGIMSDTLGCQMGDVFRAVAPMSGSGPRGTCVGQVAVWLSNGDNDTVVSTSSERMSKDFWVKANHCQTQSMPVDPSPCVAFQGCDQGFPVTWCEFSGGHTVPPFAAAAIWTFFSQF